MDTQYLNNLSNFFVAGINYKKSDASIRGIVRSDPDRVPPSELRTPAIIRAAPGIWLLLAACVACDRCA